MRSAHPSLAPAYRPVPRPHRPGCFLRAFTLLELLVVTTMIVILTAILVPILDRAIYEAELAVCSGNFKAMTTAVTAYAAEQRKYYPQRTLRFEGPNYIAASELDDRPMYRTLFSLNKVLNDPASVTVNLDTQQPRSHVWSSQFLYFDFQFEGYGRVERMGDRLEWQELTFNIVAADQDQIFVSGRWARAGHPDNTGRMVSQGIQDGEASITGTGAEAMAGATTYQTVSYWKDTTWQRAPVDRNFAYNDGSVQRYNAVAFNDPRMWVVPAYVASSWPSGPSSTDGNYTLLPK
jgi:type II secretory pathway pseudopilin PulG